MCGGINDAVPSLDTRYYGPPARTVRRVTRREGNPMGDAFDGTFWMSPALTSLAGPSSLGLARLALLAWLHDTRYMCYLADIVH